MVLQHKKKNHNNYVTHGKQVKIPISLCIRAPKTHVRESTHNCNYSWLPTSYPRREATFPSRRGEISHPI